MSGLIRVKKQLDIGKFTLLILNTSVPDNNFKKVIIDGKEYETEIAYDLKDSIGIVGKGNFENKEIEFI